MSALSLDTPRAAPHFHDPGRPRVLARQSNGRTLNIMAHPAFSTTLSPDMAARTAQDWYEKARSLAETAIEVSNMATTLSNAADNLLGVASGAPLPMPSPLPQGVYDLSAYRARRQAVTR